ncbi:hypothetical protein SLA2020_397910 [Shorea laevis]
MGRWPKCTREGSMGYEPASLLLRPTPGKRTNGQRISAVAEDTSMIKSVWCCLESKNLMGSYNSCLKA